MLMATIEPRSTVETVRADHGQVRGKDGDPAANSWERLQL
jgi:hypothetical protein